MTHFLLLFRVRRMRLPGCVRQLRLLWNPCIDPFLIIFEFHFGLPIVIVPCRLVLGLRDTTIEM